MTNAPKGGQEYEAEPLIGAVHLRFPLTPVPDIVVQIMDPDAHAFIDAMRGRLWTKVDFAVAARNTQWFFIMSDEVLAYYLPTYLAGYLASWTHCLNHWPP